jgi:hypothetical protein
MAKHDFSKLVEQRRAALKRMMDAVKLLGEEEGDWNRKKGAHARGAMYLAGYAIECKLKAIAMEVNRCRDLGELQEIWGVTENEVYTHGLEALAKRLPLYPRFRQSAVWRLFAGQVNLWRPSWRYDPHDRQNADAAKFLDAVKEVYDWLDSNN